MKTNIFISIILGAALCLSLVWGYRKQAAPTKEFQDNIAVFQGKVSDSIIVLSLSWSDTLSVYQENDILHFFPMPNGEYKVMSDIATYPIGIFSREDAKSFLRWALIIPFPREDDEYAQYHYQMIVEEKLWE